MHGPTYLKLINGPKLGKLTDENKENNIWLNDLESLLSTDVLNGQKSTDDTVICIKRLGTRQVESASQEIYDPILTKTNYNISSWRTTSCLLSYVWRSLLLKEDFY